MNSFVTVPFPSLIRGWLLLHYVYSVLWVQCTVYRYDATKQSWEKAGNMMEGREMFSIDVLEDVAKLCPWCQYLILSWYNFLNILTQNRFTFFWSFVFNVILYAFNVIFLIKIQNKHSVFTSWYRELFILTFWLLTPFNISTKTSSTTASSK